MKYISFILLLCSLTFYSKAQKTKKVGDDCVQLVHRISYFWQLDSLAGNGYRFAVYERLLECLKSGLTKEILVSNLGKPNSINEDNHESFYYTYYIYNGRLLPKELKYSKELLFISFRFDKGSIYVADIDEGHYD